MTYEVTDRVARITFNRPEKGNAIVADTPLELSALVERADLDPAVHVILVSGRGEGFEQLPTRRCGIHSIARRVGRAQRGPPFLSIGGPRCARPTLHAVYQRNSAGKNSAIKSW